MRVWLVIQDLSVEEGLKIILPGFCFHLGGQKKSSCRAGGERERKALVWRLSTQQHAKPYAQPPNSSYPLSWLI